MEVIKLIILTLLYNGKIKIDKLNVELYDDTICIISDDELHTLLYIKSSFKTEDGKYVYVLSLPTDIKVILNKLLSNNFNIGESAIHFVQYVLKDNDIINRLFSYNYKDKLINNITVDKSQFNDKDIIRGLEIHKKKLYNSIQQISLSYDSENINFKLKRYA